MESEGGRTGREDNRGINVPQLPASRLEDGAGFRQGADELPRRAIEARRLGSIQLHPAVVDAQPSQRGQDVLDEADLRGGMPQRGATLGARNLVDVSGDYGARREVRARENDPAARRGRYETQVNGSAGQEAGAAH